MSRVEVSGVAKSFGTTRVLDGIDLEVADGEVVVLLGPSGGGKTTLLRLVAGLDVVDAGEIRLGDRLVSGSDVHVAPEARQVGLVFQNGALFGHLDVAANVGFGLPRGARRGGPRIDELLDLVDLVDAGPRRPDQISGGQQQRVALARALAPAPDVLLLDEPFSNLDVELRTHLRRELRRIVDELGTTTVFVTHDQAEAFAIGDRVAVLRDGSLAQVATPAELFRSPADEWVARFVGAGCLLPATSDGRVATSALGPLELVEGAPSGGVEVLVRSDQLAIATASPESGVVGDAEGIVCRVEFGGATSEVEVEVAGVRLVATVLGTAGHRPGDRVSITVREPVRAFPAGNLS